MVFDFVSAYSRGGELLLLAHRKKESIVEHMQTNLGVFCGVGFFLEKSEQLIWFFFCIIAKCCIEKYYFYKLEVLLWQVYIFWSTCHRLNPGEQWGEQYEPISHTGFLVQALALLVQFMVLILSHAFNAVGLDLFFF